MSILKVNTIQDKGGNNLLVSDGAGTISSGGAMTNTPAFEAYANSQQTGLSSGTNVKVNFTLETLDTDGCYDTSNSRFTPTTAGKYFVYTSLYLLGPSSEVTDASIRLYKNGSEIARNNWYRPSTWIRYTTQTLTRTVDMNGSTDYLEIYGRMTTSGSNDFSIFGDSNGGDTVFGAYKIIGA